MNCLRSVPEKSMKQEAAIFKGNFQCTANTITNTNKMKNTNANINKDTNTSTSKVVFYNLWCKLIFRESLNTVQWVLICLDWKLTAY